MALVRLARLHFLIGTGIAYLIGVLVARTESGGLSAPALGRGLFVVWLIQLAAQFFNEYFDQPTDRANRHRTPFSGGSGVLVAGELKAEVAWWAGVAALAPAVALFLDLARLPTFGVATVMIFGLAVTGAVGYSIPPLAFANRGWGEIDTAVIVALLVPLFGYNLQTGQISLTLLFACLPFAALILANMINVAFPDYVADRGAGKRTLVVILGPERAARLYALLLIAGYATPWLTLGWGLPLTVLLAEAATLPLGLLSLWEMRRGGYRRPERYWRNTLLGASAVVAVGAAEIIGFLVTGGAPAIPAVTSSPTQPVATLSSRPTTTVAGVSPAPSIQPTVVPTVPPPATNVRLPDTREYSFSSSIGFDGIPPIYDPRFVGAVEAPLLDDELVIGVSLGGEAKAYPVTVLRFREIVDDELAGLPILVTW